MNFFKDIKQELIDYGFIKDPVEKRKAEIAKEEIERAESIRRKEARHQYYTELITQCNQNVGLIRAKINVYSQNLSSMGKRGKTAERAGIESRIQWLKGKLKEEEFLAEHYTKLRDARRI